MAEEFIYQRERDFLDYIRNNVTDPQDRVTLKTETFTAQAGGQLSFTLTAPTVKSVADSITVNSAPKKKGYDYSVAYGEGQAQQSVVTLTTTATSGVPVVIPYYYGSSMVEREYSRTDVELPRIVMMFITGGEEPAALGDYIEFGKGSYFNAAYRLEVRSKYATEARVLASKVYNLCQKARHAGLFRLNFSGASDLENFDYDIEKGAYVWQMTVSLTWEIIFADL